MLLVLLIWVIFFDIHHHSVLSFVIKNTNFLLFYIILNKLNKFSLYFQSFIFYLYKIILKSLKCKILTKKAINSSYFFLSSFSYDDDDVDTLYVYMQNFHFSLLSLFWSHIWKEQNLLKISLLYLCKKNDFHSI